MKAESNQDGVKKITDWLEEYDTVVDDGEGREKSDHYYMEYGADKHEQEESSFNGVSCVCMNVNLLDGFLSEQAPEEIYGIWDSLSLDDKRLVWEASNFHYGMCGYEKEDADFYWKSEKRSEKRRKQWEKERKQLEKKEKTKQNQEK